MIISMKNWERLTLAEMEEFVRGSRTAILAVQEQEAVYRFLEMLLKAQGYRRLKKSDEGIVRRFAIKVLGLSRAQVTRLICQWMRNHSIQKQPVGAGGFGLVQPRAASCRPRHELPPQQLI